MKKVLIAILVIILLVGIGVGGYFGYIKVLQPMLEEKNQQDMEQVDALGSILNQGANETETMGDISESQQLQNDGDLLSGETQSSMQSAPTTDIPLSDDASLEEVKAYISSLSEDEYYDLQTRVDFCAMEVSGIEQLFNNYPDFNMFAVDKDTIENQDVKNTDMLNESLQLVFTGENAEKKIEVVKGVLSKYSTSEIKQQFEYFGIQNGRFIIKPLDENDGCVELYFVSEDNRDIVFNKEGYPAWMLIRIYDNGDIKEYVSELSNVIPLAQQLVEECNSDSKYKLYCTLKTAFDSTTFNKGSNGDILSGSENESGGSIGETLGESGQL